MEHFWDFDAAQAGLALLLAMTAGGWLSKKLGGKIPSVLIAGIMFMLVSWTGVIPGNLSERSGFSGLTSIATGLIIAGMGASMSLRTLAENWRVVALAVCTYLFQAGTVLTGLSLWKDFNFAIGGLPGGSMTALIIQQRASQLGYDDTIVLSVLFFSTQAIIGSLIAGHHLRKESQWLLALPREEESGTQTNETAARELSFFDQSPYGSLCKLYIILWAASKVSAVTGVNLYILCLGFGVLASCVGLVDRETMKRTGAESFFLFILMSNIVSGFTRATPAMFTRMLLPLIMTFAMEVGVIYLVAPLLGKLLGFSRDMSVSLGANVMMGFPLNMMLSNEIAESLTEDEEERAYLSRQIASRMVIAGLSTTTSLAVFAGGLLVNYMT